MAFDIQRGLVGALRGGVSGYSAVLKGEAQTEQQNKIEQARLEREKNMAKFSAELGRKEYDYKQGAEISQIGKKSAAQIEAEGTPEAIAARETQFQEGLSQKERTGSAAFEQKLEQEDLVLERERQRINASDASQEQKDRALLNLVGVPTGKGRKPMSEKEAFDANIKIKELAQKDVQTAVENDQLDPRDAKKVNEYRKEREKSYGSISGVPTDKGETVKALNEDEKNRVISEIKSGKKRLSELKGLVDDATFQEISQRITPAGSRLRGGAEVTYDPALAPKTISGRELISKAKGALSRIPRRGAEDIRKSLPEDYTY